ncbi:MAG: glycosyltransferase family 4 protein [Cryobacterium sp.]|nr:glycosyltransferase family 4 protein [Cryobacterium sp.]
MRVAIVSDFFPDFIGGAQTSMREQQLALAQAGHTVRTVSPVRARGSRFRRDEHSLLVRPRLVMPGVELPVIRNTTVVRSTLAQYFRDEQIDVIHIQSEFGLSHAAIEAAAEIGLPVVHTIHTFYWTSDDNWHAFLAPLGRWLLTRVIGRSIERRQLAAKPIDSVLRNLTLTTAMRADAVVSPSAHQARDLEDAGVRAPVHIIRNPMVTSGTPSTPLTEEHARTPRFLWAARCDLVKRPLVFAQGAIEALERTRDGFSVDFVGTGGQLGALRRLAAKHPQLRVHGAIPRERLLELLDDSAAIVLSSLGFDNQPMTVVEAISRQRGVLYCDDNLTEGLTNAGYLTPRPDAGGFADALVALVNDPELLVRLSAGAAAEQEEFSGEAYVRRILRVYEAAAALR